jgi:hypothetical protein
MPEPGPQDSKSQATPLYNKQGRWVQRVSAAQIGLAGTGWLFNIAACAGSEVRVRNFALSGGAPRYSSGVAPSDTGLWR